MIYAVYAENGSSDYYFTSSRSNVLCTPHAHSHVELIFVLDGQLSLSVDDTVRLVDKGTVAIIMPYQVHFYNSEKNNTIFDIACPPEYVSEYKQIFSGKLFSPFVVPITPSMEALIKEISPHNKDRRVSRGDLHLSFKCKSLLYVAFSQLISQCSLVDTDNIPYDVYRRAMVYITEHYNQPISLSTVAQHCGVTPIHLSRLMNSRGNTGFLNIVNSLRAFQAKRLLEQTTLPISQIALDVGFGTIRSFNRIFREYFNCHPRELRFHAQSEGETPLHPLESKNNVFKGEE